LFGEQSDFVAGRVRLVVVDRPYGRLGVRMHTMWWRFRYGWSKSDNRHIKTTTQREERQSGWCVGSTESGIGARV